MTNELLADGTVGYLRIDGFSGDAAEDFRPASRGTSTQGVPEFVLDLRDDPGGFVDAALTIASQFVRSGPIYWEEYADGRKVPVGAEPDGVATDPAIAVAVLVNGGSASASEIVAGALQDTGRATLVGETTFGKGTIQQWHLLSGDSGGFRLSIAKWLTPDQHWVHGTGITPDVVVDRSPRRRRVRARPGTGSLGADSLAHPSPPALVGASRLAIGGAERRAAADRHRVLTAPCHARDRPLRAARSGYRRRERKEVMCSDRQ